MSTNSPEYHFKPAMTVPILASLGDVTSNSLLNKRRGSKGEFCFHCEGPFSVGESKIVFQNCLWHKKCFVCAQCLEELNVDMVFENENRMYCIHDYKMLFAPSCDKCNKFILEGKVIKALEKSWHSSCFTCSSCQTLLYKNDTFKRIDNNPYCKDCYESIKGGYAGMHLCFQCKGLIDPEGHLKSQGEFFHPYHFKCNSCKSELDKNFREREGSFLCLRCFDKFGIPICSACKRPVEERIIYALGKTYHVDHFVCSFCNKPFLGSRYFVHNKDVYCDLHYQMVAQRLCSYCNKDVGPNSVEFLSKHYCFDHFRCFACDTVLDIDTTIYKVDRKPICKHCLLRLPGHLRKRLATLHKKEI